MENILLRKKFNKPEIVKEPSTAKENISNKLDLKLLDKWLETTEGKVMTRYLFMQIMDYITISGNRINQVQLKDFSNIILDLSEISQEFKKEIRKKNLTPQKLSKEYIWKK